MGCNQTTIRDLQMIDDDYERTTEGAADLKRDNFNHPRTSFESLKRLAGTLSATPTDHVKRKAIQANLRDPYKRSPRKAQYWPQASNYVREQLDEMRSWILTHSSELPCELETEKGQLAQGRSYNEIPESWMYNAEEDDDRPEYADDHDWSAEPFSTYELHGLTNMARFGCYEPFDSVCAKVDRLYPTDLATRTAASAILADRFRKYEEARATRMRWRGMEEWDAVGKATEKLAEGLARTPSDSNAAPLPPIDSLQAQFEAIDGVLIRKRLNRPVTGKQVKIDGVKYVTSRVAFAVMYGQDPGSLMVRDGVATKYRNASGFVTLRADGQHDARIELTGETITVGEYATKRQAEEACGIYLKTLERWG